MKIKKRRTEKYTVVQHSGCGYAHNPDFQRGLENRYVHLKKDMDKIIQCGGVLFDNYRDVENFIMDVQYPKGYGGLIPQAPGKFIKRRIDGLFLWIPDEDSRKKAIEMGAQCKVKGDEENTAKAQ